MDKVAKSGLLRQLVPVMFCFFAMGFVDLVGIASNYVQKDLHLGDSQANVLPSLVFFWFLIFSVPAGLLMNRIGRRKTVMFSLVLTLLALLIPPVSNSYATMLVAFSLLGIGNAFMQTSLNPLVSNIMAPEYLASTLTFGQFVKAIASFLAPLIAMWGAVASIPSLGLGWKVLFPIYACICLLSLVFLACTSIREEKSDKVSGLRECLKLLGNGFIFLCFCGIMCHVGIDVGTNTTAPRILMERCGLALEDAGIATSIYFVFRTLGCLFGAGLLRRIAARPFFVASVTMIFCGLAGLMAVHNQTIIFICIALVGLGNSNVFSIIFAQALLRPPREGNEVSGLMIMGLFGGTLFPLAMGFASDIFAGQAAAGAVMAAGALYLGFYSLKMRNEREAEHE